ncbi:hypothetical protein SAMN05216452_2633 [Nitratireductor aquibiodomus]|uniref:Uncharacterized protein n=1 Tax=Nitratireductor aquibiodomus TaxID=204799 RepID=A0A1H4L555_9HYPH|nr:hypothetical protein SAMN05216452_2633 [Nitratireductor aquibiodomus]
MNIEGGALILNEELLQAGLAKSASCCIAT